MDATVTQICGLLAELLQCAAVDPDRGFLDLGGTSVLAIRASARISALHGVTLPPSEFLRNQTVREIARVVHAASPGRQAAAASMRI
jgi:Phosphopantetheine attachment site.